jgi:hypothetical protein
MLSTGQNKKSLYDIMQLSSFFMFYGIHLCRVNGSNQFF